MGCVMGKKPGVELVRTFFLSKRGHGGELKVFYSGFII